MSFFLEYKVYSGSIGQTVRLYCSKLAIFISSCSLLKTRLTGAYGSICRLTVGEGIAVEVSTGWVGFCLRRCLLSWLIGREGHIATPIIQQPLSSGRRSQDQDEDVLANQLLTISETAAEATGLRTKPLIIYTEIILAWWDSLVMVSFALAVIFPVRIED